MEKPLILKIKELDESLIQLVNNAGLPAFILARSLEKLLTELKQLEASELKNATEKYNSSLKSNKKGE